MSKIEDRFYAAWKLYGIEGYDFCRQYSGIPGRRYKFDFALPELKIAIELHGWGPGHQSLVGLRQDCVKKRIAILCGWSVLEYTSSCIGTDDKLVDAVEEVCQLVELKLKGLSK